MKQGNLKTWYGFLMPRNNIIYIGLKTEDFEKCWRWDMDIQDANNRLHRCFKHFYCNLDDTKYKGFPDAMLKDCRRIAENAWYKDCGLGYRVKDQGR